MISIHIRTLYLVLSTLLITDYELRITDDLQGCREVLITKYEVPLGREVV